MAIIVIGGQSRNIGKTVVVCSLISAMPERRWTAIKITRCKHDAPDAEPCDCELAGRTLAIDEERDVNTGKDSSRYLAAGAVRSLWVRVRAGQFAEAMPRIRGEINSSANIILESNSVLGYLKPDVYATVLDPASRDFKPSARQHLEQADAILLASPPGQEPAWSAVPADLIQRIRTFRIEPPDYSCAEFVSFVARKLNNA
ncbi:MAG: hypothetical protein ABSG84_18940 [Acidobacteriaceae bacterium]|jgi:hypothetical protein